MAFFQGEMGYSANAIFVFMAGKIGFGFISMVPVVMAGFVIADRMKMLSFALDEQ
jgi:hypothetical protein